MAESKNAIAKEFFLSLDPNENWKSRLSKTLAHMRDVFPKGQTERVVYQYVRDCLREDEIPPGSSESLRDAISAKLGGLRESHKRFSAQFSELYSGHNLVMKVISCGDLNSAGYDTKTGVDFNNSNYFRYIDGELWTSTSLPKHKISVDAAVGLVDEIDFSTHPKIKFRDIFPYFDKQFLETPVPAGELCKLAADLLSSEERRLLEEACAQGRSFPKAIEWLSAKGLEKRQADYTREVEKIYREAQKQSGSGSSRTLLDKLIGFIFVVGMAASIGYCVETHDPDAGKTKLQRDTERLCDAVGGCYDN